MPGKVIAVTIWDPPRNREAVVRLRDDLRAEEVINRLVEKAILPPLGSREQQYCLAVKGSPDDVEIPYDRTLVEQGLTDGSVLFVNIKVLGG